MIKVIDNALPQLLADKLFEITHSSDFPWFLTRDVYKVITEDSNTVNTIQMGHTIFDSDSDDPVHNPNLWLVCLEALGLIIKTTPNPLMVKFNLLLNNSNMSEGKYNTPHVDNALKNSLSIIYYVNDSDGDTIIFNETDTPFTIKQRITPKKNRAVIFDSAYYHTSSNPIKNEHRVVMNTTTLNSGDVK